MKYTVPCQNKCCPTIDVEDDTLKIADDYDGSVLLTHEQFEQLYDLYRTHKAEQVIKAL